MSRKTTYKDGIKVEVVIEKHRCKYLSDEVCCNDSCREWLADYPTLEDCKRCEHREDEQ